MLEQSGCNLWLQLPQIRLASPGRRIMTAGLCSEPSPRPGSDVFQQHMLPKHHRCLSKIPVEVDGRVCVRNLTRPASGSAPTQKSAKTGNPQASGELIRRWNRRPFTLRIASAREDSDFAERQGTLYAVGIRTCTDCLFAGVFRTSESSTVFYGREFLQIIFPYRSSAA